MTRHRSHWNSAYQRTVDGRPTRHAIFELSQKSHHILQGLHKKKFDERLENVASQFFHDSYYIPASDDLTQNGQSWRKCLLRPPSDDESVMKCQIT